MDQRLFEQLLFEEESPTLDFKGDQYRFSKATDEEKSELLKDVLGFANAWRRSDAFILIGVEEVRGGRSNVVGIAQSEQLQDHSLQQFVNNLTNSPLRFHYEAFSFEGKQVGVIRIEQQPRPVYLKRDYGKLQAQKVYVRRGTSTDPSKPATPEEMVAMGRENASPAAELSVQFSAINDDTILGTSLTIEAEMCRVPDQDEIPDLRDDSYIEVEGRSIRLPEVSFEQTNSAYYRELAMYTFAKRLFRPLRLAIQNVGQVAAINVRCELVVAVAEGMHLVELDQLQDAPKMRYWPGHRAIRDVRPVHSCPGDVVIEKNGQRFALVIECGTLQPGRRVLSEVFYLGKAESGQVVLSGKTYADNMPRPSECALTVQANVTQSTMTMEQLMNLADLEELEES